MRLPFVLYHASWAFLNWALDLVGLCRRVNRQVPGHICLNEAELRRVAAIGAGVCLQVVVLHKLVVSAHSAELWTIFRFL